MFNSVISTSAFVWMSLYKSVCTLNKYVFLTGHDHLRAKPPIRYRIEHFTWADGAGHDMTSMNEAHLCDLCIYKKQLECQAYFVRVRKLEKLFFPY